MNAEQIEAEHHRSNEQLRREIMDQHKRKIRRKEMEERFWWLFIGAMFGAAITLLVEAIV